MGRGDSRNGAPTGPRRNHAVWLGPVVVFVGAVSYFTWFARFPALRDFPWVNLPLVAGGLALSAWGAWRAFSRPGRFLGKALGSLGLAFSLGLGTLFVAYVFVLSYQLPGPTRTALGIERAPEFSLPDHRGRPVRLADLRGRKVVITFYRGHW